MRQHDSFHPLVTLRYLREDAISHESSWKHLGFELFGYAMDILSGSRSSRRVDTTEAFPEWPITRLVRSTLLATSRPLRRKAIGFGKIANEYVFLANLAQSQQLTRQFLIKGVPYEPRNSSLPGPESRINPLSDDWLENLRKDIPFFHRLGINTMFIECADATQSPRQAMQLLQNEGIYVLLKLDTDLVRGDSGQLKAAKINIARMYSPDEVRKNLAIVRQTARFSIVRGYKISQSKIWTDATTKLAALHRAAVRDTKLFLKKLGLRPIPVGSSMSSDQMYRLNVIRYMTAGSPEERVDFISFGVYDWVGPSSFQMSGYKHLIKAFEAFPVPMFWGE